MANSERPGKLTYERLAKSLGRLHESVTTQFPQLQDAQRARDLQRAIKDALTTVRASTGGAAIASPAELKRDLKKRIAEIHEKYDEPLSPHNSPASSAFTPSSANSNAPHFSKQRASAPKRTVRSSTVGKENLTPATAPAPSQPSLTAPRILSAIKKTPLIKRGTNTRSNGSKPSTTKLPNSKSSTITPGLSTSGVKKRSSKSSSNHPATPAQSMCAGKGKGVCAEEAERRACAAALLGLASQDASPETSLASFESGVSEVSPGSAGAKHRSAERGRKRDRTAYEDEAVHETDGSEKHGWVASSPLFKRRKSAFDQLPCLDGCAVDEAFEMGVQYAVAQMSSASAIDEGRDGSCNGNGVVGVDITAWVRREMGRRDSAQGKALTGGVAQNAGCPKSKTVLTEGIQAAKKGFWDVV